MSVSVSSPNLITESSRHNPSFVWPVVLAAVLVVITLSACGKNDDGKTVGQSVDAAIAKSERAANEAKIKTESAMSDAGTNLKKAVQKAEISGKEIADKAETKFDDMTITAAVKAEIAKAPELSAFKVSVDTKSGAVVLTGSAPTSAARERASQVAHTAKGVTSVKNELVVTNN